VNNTFKGMPKEVIVAYFKLLLQECQPFAPVI